MTISSRVFILLATVFVGGCAGTGQTVGSSDSHESLVGAWRSDVQFSSGDFASIHDLEFLYAFSGDRDGGTLTESSNYDAAPPVPPAYGAWRSTGPRTYRARYVFFTTKPPESLDAITKGNGWSPAGRGELTELITLSNDGRSFSSRITLQLFDTAGNPIPNSTSAATGSAQRITGNP